MGRPLLLNEVKDMVKYVVMDPCNENHSPFYLTKEEAERDLDNSISFQWSLEAEILEAEVR